MTNRVNYFAAIKLSFLFTEEKISVLKVGVGRGLPALAERLGI